MAKRDITISMITNETMKLAYQVGLDRVKVSVIIKNLHLNRGTFYHYFKDKYDVIEQMETQLIDEIQVIQNRIINQNIHELRHDLSDGVFIGKILDMLEQNRNLVRFVFSDKGDISFINYFENCFKTINEHTIKKVNATLTNKQLNMIATFITSSIIGWFKLYIQHPEIYSKQDILDASNKLIRQNLLNHL